MNTNIIKKETEIIGIQAILRDVTEKKILEERLNKNYKKLIRTLTAFIEVKDLYTEKHSKRIARDSVFLAEQLNISDEQIKDIEIAALLHDLGKIKISIDILNKKGKLTAKEWEIMKKHSELGEQTIKNMPEFRYASKLIKYHHERYDGKGVSRKDSKERTFPLEHVLLLLLMLLMLCNLTGLIATLYPTKKLKMSLLEKRGNNLIHILLISI